MLAQIFDKRFRIYLNDGYHNYPDAHCSNWYHATTTVTPHILRWQPPLILSLVMSYILPYDTAHSLSTPYTYPAVSYIQYCYHCSNTALSPQSSPDQDVLFWHAPLIESIIHDGQDSEVITNIQKEGETLINIQKEGEHSTTRGWRQRLLQTETCMWQVRFYLLRSSKI